MASAYFSCASSPNALAESRMLDVLLSRTELNMSVYCCGFVSLNTCPVAESTNLMSFVVLVI